METRKKKHYEGLSITPVSLEMERQLLAGSNTLQGIEVQRVTVEPFENELSFPTDGFEVDFE